MSYSWWVALLLLPGQLRVYQKRVQSTERVVRSMKSPIKHTQTIGDAFTSYFFTESPTGDTAADNAVIDLIAPWSMHAELESALAVTSSSSSM